MKSTIIALAIIGTLTACTYESYNQREIVGQWYSESWTSDGAATGYRAWIAFEQDSSYRAIFNANKEQGTYWIDGHRLYTHADGESPIVVKITSLDEAQMILEMNRGGSKEELVFGKGKVNRANELSPEDLE